MPSWRTSTSASFPGKFDEAIDLLDRARREEPSNYLILQRLGDLYRSLERPSEAIDAYEQAIAIAPDHGELWAKKGDALIDDRKADAAVDAFRQAARLTASAFTELDWNLRGDRCYSYQDYETAGRLYKNGLAVRPNADGWRGLGLIALAWVASTTPRRRTGRGSTFSRSTSTC